MSHPGGKNNSHSPIDTDSEPNYSCLYFLIYCPWLVTEVFYSNRGVCSKYQQVPISKAQPPQTRRPICITENRFQTSQSYYNNTFNIIIINCYKLLLLLFINIIIIINYYKREDYLLLIFML